MIDDGYNRFAELKFNEEIVRIEYRPATRHERWVVLNRILVINDEDFARETLIGEIQRRILAPEWAKDLASDEERVFSAAVKCIMGQQPRIDEDADVRNLREGVRFQLRHPALAGLSCATCQKWLLDPITGEFHGPKGKRILRQPEDVLLCQTHDGCPKGTPNDPKGLSAKNAQALRHYLECQAIGQFPDDAIVKRNARIIAQVYEEHRKEIDRAKRVTK